MMKRFLLASSALLAAAGLSYGEEQRTLLTLENKFPELHQIEAGVNFVDRQFDKDSYSLVTVGPTVRYGLLPDLAVYGEVPLAFSSRDGGSDGAGLGDIKAGLQLLAYKDIFGYPWIVPHVDASFNTGDGDKGTGYGDNVFTFGISGGAKMYDQISFILDASYAVNGGFESGNSTSSDSTIFAGSVVYDLSERLAALAEGKIVQDNNEQNVHQPKCGGGGLVYKYSERLTIGAYVYGWVQAENQTDVTVKGIYKF